MIKKLVVMMGVPASGKSTYVDTWVEELDENGRGHVVIRPDDIREELTGDASDQSANDEVFGVAHMRLRQSLRSSAPIVFFDATNVRPFARQNILDIVEECNLADGVKVSPVLVVMNINLEDAKRRNRTRDRVVPDHAIERMYEQFLDATIDAENEPWDHIIYA